VGGQLSRDHGGCGFVGAEDEGERESARGTASRESVGIIPSAYYF